MLQPSSNRRALLSNEKDMSIDLAREQKKENSQQPFVAIVLLNYISYIDTVECLESLDALNHKNYEIIVVDNASPNESLTVLKERFPHHTILNSGENLGFAGGCNVGIRYALQAGADYILLLNNDTIVSPNFLLPLLRRFDQDETIGMVGGKVFYYHEPKKIWFAGGAFNWFAGRGYCLGQDELDSSKWSRPREVPFLTCAFVLVKRHVFENIGLLCEDYFLGGEEWDFSIRASQHGYRLYYEPASTIWHKVTGSHKKYTPRYIYNGTRTKLKFMRCYCPKWLYPFWYIGIRVYLRHFAPRKFKRLSPQLEDWEIRQAIEHAISDERPKRARAITAADLSRIQDSICKLQLVPPTRPY